MRLKSGLQSSAEEHVSEIHRQPARSVTWKSRSRSSQTACPESSAAGQPVPVTPPMVPLRRKSRTDFALHIVAVSNSVNYPHKHCTQNPGDNGLRLHGEAINTI